MLRWFKNGKKVKSKPSKDTRNDNYGFVSNSKKQNSRNGLDDRSNDNLDSSVHIYHEISEVPEISFSRQFTLLPEKTNLAANGEGPYLVVPILPARKPTESDSSQIETTINKSSMKCKNKKRIYNEPWDKTEEHTSFPHPAFRDSNSSYTCSSVSATTESSRTNESDTGCEYDMSTSAASDVSSEYKELINKMQSNLTLKHQILKMIKESENKTQESHFKKTSSLSLDSCEFIRSRDIGDKEETESESEYSSGFDECEISGSINYHLPSSTREKTNSPLNFLEESNKPQTHSDSIKELYIPPKTLDNLHDKSTKRHSWNQPVPKLVPKQTNMCKNQKQGGYRSSNRLLGDLINMNHNIQTLKF